MNAIIYFPSPTQFCSFLSYTLNFPSFKTVPAHFIFLPQSFILSLFTLFHLFMPSPPNKQRFVMKVKYI